MKITIVLFLCICVSKSLHAQDWKNITLRDAPPGPAMAASVFFGDTGIVIAGDGIFYHTKDCFQTWYLDSSFIGINPDAIAFATREIGYIASAQVQGGLLKSLDGGASWNSLGTGPLSGKEIGDFLQFVNVDTAYAAFKWDPAVRTTYDSGYNWSYQTLDLNLCQRIFNLQFTNSSTGYILCNDVNLGVPGYGNMSIFKTIDYGKHWSNFSSPSPKGFGYLYFADDTTAFLTARGCILKSVNGAQNFDTVMTSNNLGDDYFRAITAVSFANRDTGYVAYRASVYKTCNAGNTWFRTNFAFADTDINNSINFIKAVTGDKAIVGCNRGNIYKTATGGGVWSGVKVVEQNDFILSPNPTNDLLTIETGTSKDLKASIYSVDGRLLKSNIALQQKTQLDVSFLTPGIYFLVVTDSEERSVKRFVKQ